MIVSFIESFFSKRFCGTVSKSHSVNFTRLGIDKYKLCKVFAITCTGTQGPPTCEPSAISFQPPRLVCLCIVALHPSNIWGISARVATWDGLHSWRLYSAALMGHHTASTIIYYPTESLYTDIEPTRYIMLSARIGGGKYQFISHRFEFTMVRTHKIRISQSSSMGDRHSTHLATACGYLTWLHACLIKYFPST